MSGINGKTGAQRSRNSLNVKDSLNPSFNAPEITRSKSIKRGSMLMIPKVVAVPDSDAFYRNGDQDFIKKVSERFINFNQSDRVNLIISLFKICDPTELTILGYKIPKLHRNYLELFPAHINYMILTYIQPKDFCTVVCVSKTWAKIATDIKAWETIYSRLGLLNMVSNCYSPELPMIANAKRLYALRNWSKGVFTLKHIRAHPLGILCIAFDGKLVATGSVDRTCRIFDVRTGKRLHSLSGHEQKLFSVALNGNRVYTGSSDQTINIWDLDDNGRLIGTLTGHDGTITCLKSQGNLLFSASDDKTVRIWDVSNQSLKAMDFNFKFAAGLSEETPASGLVTDSRPISRGLKRHPCLLRVLHGHCAAVRSIDINQNVLISGDIYGTVRIWHVDSGNCLAKMYIHPDGKHEMEVLDLLSIGLDRPKILSKAATDPITAIQYTGTRLVIATFTGNAFIYKIQPFEVNSPQSKATYTNLRSWIYSNSTISLYSKHKIDSLSEKKKNIDTWALCAHSDSWRLMLGGSEGHCTLWNHQNQKILYELKGNTIDNGSGSVQLEVGEYYGGSPLDPSFESIKESGTQVDRAITGVSFDDHFIVAGGMDGVIRIWEAAVKIR